MAELYLTFGVKYGNAEEREQWPHKEPHPLAPWASGNGYAVIEYRDEPQDPEALTQPMDGALPARERARRAAWAWLGGIWAFDYAEAPEPEYAPLGELARLVLP